MLCVENVLCNQYPRRVIITALVRYCFLKLVLGKIRIRVGLVLLWNFISHTWNTFGSTFPAHFSIWRRGERFFCRHVFIKTNQKNNKKITTLIYNIIPCFILVLCIFSFSVLFCYYENDMQYRFMDAVLSVKPGDGE